MLGCSPCEKKTLCVVQNEGRANKSQWAHGQDTWCHCPPMESTPLESTECGMYFPNSLPSVSPKGKTVGFHGLSRHFYCLLALPYACPETPLVYQSILTEPPGCGNIPPHPQVRSNSLKRDLLWKHQSQDLNPSLTRYYSVPYFNP